jgi:hypothetical protein
MSSSLLMSCGLGEYYKSSFFKFILQFLPCCSKLISYYPIITVTIISPTFLLWLERTKVLPYWLESFSTVDLEVDIKRN